MSVRSTSEISPTNQKVHPLLNVYSMFKPTICKHGHRNYFNEIRLSFKQCNGIYFADRNLINSKMP